MSDCKTYRTEFEDAAHGLSDAARAHAASCGACGEVLRAGDSLNRILRGLERIEAPADFEFRLRARIAARKGGRGRFQLARFGSLSGYATVAAALCVLALAASLYFKPGQRHAPLEVRNVGAPAIRPNGAPRPSGQTTNAPTPVSSPPITNVTLPTPASHSRNGNSPRLVALKSVKETAGVAEGRKNLASNQFSELGATAIVRHLVIPVSTPAEPLRVVLRDEKGTAHVVPMRTVSFGSQELLSREVAGARPGAKNEEGVW
jgi:hypothetical protein